jgi:hypothetical protein
LLPLLLLYIHTIIAIYLDSSFITPNSFSISIIITISTSTQHYH